MKTVLVAQPNDGAFSHHTHSHIEARSYDTTTKNTIDDVVFGLFRWWYHHSHFTWKTMGDSYSKPKRDKDIIHKEEEKYEESWGRLSETTPLTTAAATRADDHHRHHHHHQATGTDRGDVETQRLHHNCPSQQNQEPTSGNTHLLYVLVISAGATAASLGYDVGILADAILPMRIDLQLTGLQEELIVGSLNVAAAIGSFVAGHLADTQGRKATVKWCAWVFIVGMVLMTYAWDFPSMLLGRIITGLGVGISFLVAPIYITEVAPQNKRGELNTVFDISINVGILLGYVTGFVIHIISPGNWRLMFGVGLVLPVAVQLTLAQLPESPRWLMMVDRENDAVEALMQLGHCSSRRQAQDMTSHMLDEFGNERSTVRWGPNHMSAIGYGLFQQIAGSEAILYYSSSFLQQSGMTSPALQLLGNCLVGVCKLLPELAAMKLIDSLGRRTLMLTSAIARVLTLFALCLGFYLEFPPVVMLVILCSIVFSFSIGLGPFSLLVASESLASRERSSGMVYCIVANRSTSAIVALTVVTLTRLMGNGNLFLLYTALAIVSLFFYARMTETAGKSLEDIQKNRR
jgi:sugar porter (SP) family MFS transporter